MAINGDKVYIVVYSFCNMDYHEDNETRVKVFATEKEAEAYLKKDYEDTLNECSDEDNVYEVISSDNWENNAEILIGEKEGELIYYKHTWRVQMQTIGFEE